MNLPLICPLKSGQKQPMHIKNTDLDVSKNGAFANKKVPCNDYFYNIQNHGMARVIESMNESISASYMCDWINEWIIFLHPIFISVHAICHPYHGNSVVLPNQFLLI